jgi:CRISPR-associated protein Cas1
MQPARALEIARELIAAKIENGGAVLARYAARAGDRASAPGFAAEAEAAASAGDIAVLDGVEGSAARRYFGALMRHNKSALIWDGRKKHPAPDPLNALLSLAYTLLMHEMGSLLEGVGLDPYLGFLHQMDYGRPSLALDVIEPFRHAVSDRFVLQLVNKQVIDAGDFESHGGSAAVFLTPAALIRFFECHEKWMLNRPPGQPSFRERLRHTAEGLDAAIRDGSKYTAYRFDHEAEDECFTSSVTI